MSSETLFQAPRKYQMTKIRAHDYLYDSAYIVSGARDYARTAFKAAMTSAQVVIQPVYKTMFSELRKFPRVQVLYHPNCRLPSHIDRSYTAYVERSKDAENLPAPQLAGRDRFMFSAMPRQVLPLKSATPEFRPTSANTQRLGPTKPRNRGVQTMYRESSAQTYPWQPDYKVSEECEDTPEVLYLDKLDWGPGKPYRTGDLPADFHTTEIINKMRHARQWTELVEKGEYPPWMKRRDAIISDVETRDWIFREAEIDELQDIRLALLHKLQAEKRRKKTNRSSRKLAKLWDMKKQEMERRIANIHQKRDRELRKLTSNMGTCERAATLRATRGGGPVTSGAYDPTSELLAPKARNGYQARRRHAHITYDLSLLEAEDHETLADLPPWLENCGQNLKKTCSGHHLKQDPTALCERESKWSEKFLENLHNELKKARVGATASTPLRVIKPRHLSIVKRPPTPEVEPVTKEREAYHQSSLLLQKIIRGRAVHNLMYEGRARATQLIEELKTTHGLQKEDKARIAIEEIDARDKDDVRAYADRKEAAVTALVEELCGAAVSSALDFLEKELRRLKEERKQHAFILIAIREKAMREAAEAGRRQKEEHRRREHDEMFKQVLGVTQETVDVYLREIVDTAVDYTADKEAVGHVRRNADRIDASLEQFGSVSTAEQNETVAELVHQFLLPEAHKMAARERIDMMQRANLVAAREKIFRLLDEAEIKKEICSRCGQILGDSCRCSICPIGREPVEKPDYRNDPRWKYTKRHDVPPAKDVGERYPPQHEFRCMLNTLVDEVVVEARKQRAELTDVKIEYGQKIKEKVEINLDVRDIVEECVESVIGLRPPSPVKELKYHHFMARKVGDAMERSVPFEKKRPCPDDLPSEIRRRAEEQAALDDPTCRCEDMTDSKLRLLNILHEAKPCHMLPSELRTLEELRRCKCDADSVQEAEQAYLAEELSPSEMTYLTEKQPPNTEDSDYS